MKAITVLSTSQARGHIRWRLLLSATCLLFAIFLLRGCDLDDEEQLRRIVRDMRDAFNGMSARECVSPLAEEFHERVYNLDKMSLRRVLAGIFVTERNREDGSFRWRVECLLTEMSVEFPEKGADRANLVVPARFFRQGSSAVSPAWEVRFSASAARIEGSWQLVIGAFVTTAGRCPF